MVRSRLTVAALVVISLCALSLRWHGTGWGAPYGYHFDEPFILKPALRIASTGDPNPRFFRYPSALIYMESAVALIHHAASGMDLTVPEGPAYGPSDLGRWSWPALLSGRRLVSVLGSLTVVAVACTAWSTGGPLAALVAAVLLALLPLHVEHSHYLTTDVPAACFLAIAFALAARVQGTPWRGFSAGAALGAAVATKYTAIAGLPGLLAVLLLRGTARTRTVVAACLGLLGAFVLLCPYSIIDWRLFLADLQIVRQHYQSGHLGAEGPANWGWYLLRLRDSGLGPTGLAVLGGGFIAAFADALTGGTGGTTPQPRNRGAWVAVVLAATSLGWFAWLGSVPVRFERNIIPAIVLATAASGHGIAALGIRAWRRHPSLGVVVAMMVSLAMLPVARMASATTRRFAATDTRQETEAWITTHIPIGARIVREEYSPRPDPERYRVEYIWSAAFRDPFWYRRNEVDYVVVSDAVYRRFMRDPQHRYPQIVERYKRMFAWPQAVRIAPGLGRMGPTITILRPPPPTEQQ